MVLLLLTVLTIMLIMELRIWRAFALLIYRTGRRLSAPVKHKDTHP
ncbi:hypothetical protein [uncultured Roseibium sp.]|nr:hypothetical protein [uncultured Roseibium sp.]